VAKHSRGVTIRAAGVRTRRAYFDCRYGQLHVRTAFPATGGFDEQVTLCCLHAADGSSRLFARFLPEMAAARSVYAPDLPGHGESDAGPTGSATEAAQAVGDLAAGLRLRQMDLLGAGLGAGAALELAAAHPELVRRLVLLRVPPMDRVPPVRQPCLVLRIKLGSSDDTEWTRTGLAHARFLDLKDYTSDLFDVAPKALAEQIAHFLDH
jgi:pimeloyl-ACP methyl ester carboxylesterase